MTAAHTDRGKLTERMVARWFRDRGGFPHCERVVRTGYRTADRDSADTSDLTLCPGVIVQVKALRPANRAERAVEQWIRETREQRDAAGADVGLLVVRRDGTADVGEWWAWLRLADVVYLLTGDDRHHDPEAWTARDVIPLRMLVRDAAHLLHVGGYGTAPGGAA